MKSMREKDESPCFWWLKFQPENWRVHFEMTTEDDEGKERISVSGGQISNQKIRSICDDHRRRNVAGLRCIPAKLGKLEVKVD